MSSFVQTNADGTREERLDNGDGTGTHTFYDAEGNVTSTENLTGLLILPPELPTDAERVADLEAVIAALLEA